MKVTSNRCEPKESRSKLVEAEAIDPGLMPKEELDVFFRRLYRVHEKIFAGVSPESFARYLSRRDAIRTRIQVYRNATGKVVGYCAVHIFEPHMDNRIIGVIRAEAGLLPGYRGTSATLWFGGAEALRYKALHPLRTTVLFATPVHPSSFHMLSKYLWRSYPYPGRKTPRWAQRLLERLADSAGGPQADPADPLLRRVGWITRDTVQDHEKWHTRPEPDIQYFLRRNPRYGSGVGLAMIAPLSPRNLLVSAGQYLLHLLLRKILPR